MLFFPKRIEWNIRENWNVDWYSTEMTHAAVYIVVTLKNWKLKDVGWIKCINFPKLMSFWFLQTDLLVLYACIAMLQNVKNPDVVRNFKQGKRWWKEFPSVLWKTGKAVWWKECGRWLFCVNDTCKFSPTFTLQITHALKLFED